MLPLHLKELALIDEVLADFVHRRLDFNSEFFYIPSPKTAPFIAKTFDINIDNMNYEGAKALLEAPMLSKSTLGTQKAIKEGIGKIFGEVVIQTKKEDSKLRPFEFSLKITAQNSINEQTLEAINTLIDEKKPLRDSMAGLDFAMPSIKSGILFKTSIQWRL